MTSVSKVRSVNCPGCGKEVKWIEQNTHRPFCSERCKLIDFGEWATEKHSIPGAPVYAELEDDDDGGLQ